MILLFAQMLMVLMLTLWLSLGVFDNLRHPKVNGLFVGQVLELELLKAEFPELYEMHKARAVHSKAVQAWMFRAIVCAEGLAVLLLWGGVLSLCGALFGAVAAAEAQAFATLGVLAFTMIWSGFLVAGNYWCYWMCHEGAQNTHFQMTLWGIGVMILLAQ